MNDLGRHLEGRTRRTQDRQEGEGDGETEKCKVGLFCFVKTFQRGMPLTPIRCTEIWTSGSGKTHYLSGSGPQHTPDNQINLERNLCLVSQEKAFGSTVVCSLPMSLYLRA